MEDVLLCAAALLAEDERVAAAGPPAVPAGSWSTSSRTSARCRQRCSTCGSAVATTSAWSATRPRRSTPSPARARRTCCDFPAKHPGTTSVELVRNYRSTPQVVDVANRLLAGSQQRRLSSSASQTDAGPEVTFAEHSDEVAEAERWRPTRSRWSEAGTPGPGHRRPVPDQRPVRDLRGGAGRPRRALRRPRRGPVLRAGRGQAGRHAAARQRPRRRRARRRRPGHGRPGRCWPAWAGRRRRRPAAATPGTAGSRCRRSCPRPRSSWPPTRRRRSPASSPSSTGAPPSSTPRSPRASRWPRCTPPRASSGTWCSSSAPTRARCRSSTPTAAPRSRRSDGCSTSG